jgi:MFS family permease
MASSSSILKIVEATYRGSCRIAGTDRPCALWLHRHGGTPTSAAGQPGRRRYEGLVARRAVDGFLAAHFELWDLRVLDQRLDQYTPDSLRADRGIAAVTGASVLAALGVFSLIGSALSGWLCDRFNPRGLLFWYYSLRGLSLIVVPFSEFDFVSLSIFSVFYGLDWVATGPATFALTNEVFGRRDTPVILSWIFAGHQVGGALAAFGAGAVRSTNGDYLLAFITSGLACLVASLLVLRVSRHQLVVTSAG